MKKLTKKQAGGDTSATAKAQIDAAKKYGFKNDNKNAAKRGVDTTKVATYRAPWAPKRGEAGTLSVPLDAKKKGGAVKKSSAVKKKK